ncbi:hypothetical protein B0H11DRAFT_2369562 [Mycena galericulata]|nr:hypothetical protein B0H11DRAFT_2369562 [Mycena galericulata]
MQDVYHCLFHRVPEGEVLRRQEVSVILSAAATTRNASEGFVELGKVDMSLWEGRRNLTQVTALTESTIETTWEGRDSAKGLGDLEMGFRENRRPFISNDLERKSCQSFDRVGDMDDARRAGQRRRARRPRDEVMESKYLSTTGRGLGLNHYHWVPREDVLVWKVQTKLAENRKFEMEDGRWIYVHKRKQQLVVQRVRLFGSEADAISGQLEHALLSTVASRRVNITAQLRAILRCADSDLKFMIKNAIIKTEVRDYSEEGFDAHVYRHMMSTSGRPATLSATSEDLQCLTDSFPSLLGTRTQPRTWADASRAPTSCTVEGVVEWRAHSKATWGIQSAYRPRAWITRTWTRTAHGRRSRRAGGRVVAWRLRAYAARRRGESALSCASAEPPPLSHGHTRTSSPARRPPPTPLRYFLSPPRPSPRRTPLKPLRKARTRASSPYIRPARCVPRAPATFFAPFPSSSVYLRDPLNATRKAACRNASFLVGPPLDVCLDARDVGEGGRWVRSGCWSKAEVRAYMCGSVREEQGRAAAGRGAGSARHARCCKGKRSSSGGSGTTGMRRIASARLLGSPWPRVSMAFASSLPHSRALSLLLRIVDGFGIRAERRAPTSRLTMRATACAECESSSGEQCGKRARGGESVAVLLVYILYARTPLNTLLSASEQK